MSSTGSKSAERGGAPAPALAVTSGEPAGIGPEVCLALAERSLVARPVVLADIELMRRRAALLGRAVSIVPYRRAAACGAHAAGPCLEVLHLPLAAPCTPGRLDPANSRYVLALLERALKGCEAGEFAAMVTAPLHKGVINDAGIAFSGHTEYLAERTATPRVVMMLCGGSLRVALATTHIALSEVPAAITAEGLEATLRVLVAALARDFGIEAPRVLVAGLNPHCGEGGHFGREDIDVIEPVLARLRAEGLRLAGPLPADTLFNRERLREADCVLCMYHDQGLPVLKFASFGAAVNVTLGLPIVRTSVDHGTALELAGSGRAGAGSLVAALEVALQMVRRRSQPAPSAAAA